jgi:hypothetical protein
MVPDRDRFPMPDDARDRPLSPSTVSVVSVAILGHSARPPPIARRRGPLLMRMVEKLVYRREWPSVDAVLLPGGFFRLRNAIGALSQDDRRSALIATKAAKLCAEASRVLEAQHPTSMLVVGLDADPVSRKVGGDQLVAAWRAGDVAGLARKTFPSDGDTNGKLTSVRELEEWPPCAAARLLRRLRDTLGRSFSLCRSRRDAPRTRPAWRFA